MESSLISGSFAPSWLIRAGPHVIVLINCSESLVVDTGYGTQLAVMLPNQVAFMCCLLPSECISPHACAQLPKYATRNGNYQLVASSATSAEYAAFYLIVAPRSPYSPLSTNRLSIPVSDDRGKYMWNGRRGCMKMRGPR